MQTILIAEDEGAIRKLVSAVLRAEGYHVLSASSGQDAVAAAERHHEPIDLLVTDIVMAGMGGADLYAWLKTERPDMKVLFMSGYMSREPLEGAFLKKPFTPAELIAKVRQLLSAASSSAP
jgi:two-component system, cell cycle sensor histidine kinase and response regulator CckA